MARKALATVEELPEEEPVDSSFLVKETRADHDLESFRRRVAEVAYLKAEKRGFEPGFEMEDWLEAEREVQAELSAAGG